MKRFADIVAEHHAPVMQKRAGLDAFEGTRCLLCGVTFDSKDSKIWTRETGKVHYRCYAEWRQK